MKKFRLGILPYIIILCVFAFIIVEIRNTRLIDTSAQVKQANNLELIDAETWNKIYNSNQKVKNENTLIIYEKDDENSLETYKNIKYVLESINVNVVEKDIAEQRKITNISNFDTMIICIQNFENLEYTFQELDSWVKAGNGIFFTQVMQNNDKLKEYASLLGIEKKENITTIEYKNMTFIDDFLVCAKNMTFGELTINGTGLKAELNKDVTIHATTADDEKNPIIWNLKYGKGHITVCNANMLHDKVCRGIISAGYAQLHEYYAYPIINSSMYCIDDFPSPIPIGYNQNIYEEYECSMEDFYFNIWWPRMKKYGEKYGIKYTGLLIQTYEDVIEPPYNNTKYMETSKYYANSLLNIGGELGLHGYNHQSLALTGFDYMDEEVNYNPWKSIDNMFEATRSAIAYGNELAPNAKITSYVAPSNIISSYVQKEMEKNIEDIKVYAGVYIGNEAQMVQEFEAKENGIVHVPRTDSGMNIENDINSDFLMCNELSYHYVHSNFFHPDDILDAKRGADEGFETLCVKYEEMVKKLNNTGIRNTTVAEGGAAVQRYDLTSCYQENKDDKLTLEVKGIFDEVYYFLHVNDGKKIKNIEGAEYNKVNENYYVLKITQENVVIEME